MSEVLLQVRSQYHRLSKSHKKIADYLVNNRETFVNQTAQEIGEASQTSSASVIRLAKRLSFDGLEEMKRQLIIDSYSEKLVIDPIINENEDIEGIVDKVKVLITNSFEDMFFQLDYQKIKEAVNLIKEANRLYIFGIGASSLPAYDMYHKFMRINKPAFFDFDSHMTLEFLHYATEDDVIILFSYSGNSIETIYPGQLGQRSGVPVISITSDDQSLVAHYSDVVISIPRSEEVLRIAALTSKLNSLILVDILYLGAISPHLDQLREDLIATNKITRKLKAESPVYSDLKQRK